MKAKIAYSQTYLELISKTDKEKQEDNLEITNEAALTNMQTAIHHCNKRILLARQTVITTKQAIPFSANAVITAMNDLAIQERELKQLQELKKELFNEN